MWFTLFERIETLLGGKLQKVLARMPVLTLLFQPMRTTTESLRSLSASASMTCGSEANTTKTRVSSYFSIRPMLVIKPFIIFYIWCENVCVKKNGSTPTMVLTLLGSTGITVSQTTGVETSLCSTLFWPILTQTVTKRKTESGTITTLTTALMSQTAPSRTAKTMPSSASQHQLSKST